MKHPQTKHFETINYTAKELKLYTVRTPSYLTLNVLFCPVPPTAQTTLIGVGAEGAQVSPACPSDNSIKRKMSVELWWDDTHRKLETV